jgi:integrase
MAKNGLIVSTLVKGMREDYFNVRGETPATVSTWKGDYLQLFKKLPQSRKLTEDLLREAILGTVPNSRQRRRFVLAASKLADFAQIDHSLRRLIGNYSTQKVNPRTVPDDLSIATTWKAISNENWQYVYGLMATYGLRNCEVFLLNFSQFPVLEVDKSKGGDSRLVYPLYPEWVDYFNLNSGKLPECIGKCNSDLGNRVTHAFRRYGVPFTPFNLRHAWARRSLEFGMSNDIASAMMGHSVKIHTEVYHHWLSDDVFKRAYEKVVNNASRPIAPVVKRLLT